MRSQIARNCRPLGVTRKPRTKERRTRSRRRRARCKFCAVCGKQATAWMPSHEARDLLFSRRLC